jgi:hypothetical protein
MNIIIKIFLSRHEDEPIIDQEGDQHLELAENLEASDEEAEENLEESNQKE